MLSPYYQDERVTIYNNDIYKILDELPAYDLVIADPPYGINHKTNYKARDTPFKGRKPPCNNYKPVYGDNKPFDPTVWLDKPCCLWGANYFADKLPPSSGWLVWDKERGDTLDQATCELAWTNFVKGVRRLRWLWDGFRRKGKDPLVHPTQKPVGLFTWILSLKWTPDGTILDPFMGSGPCLVAAKQQGRKVIGVEIEESYCEIAAKSLQQESLFFFERPLHTLTMFWPFISTGIFFS